MEHYCRVSEQQVLHSQRGQLLAASATEKDCLLLGLLSGQMREIAVRLARSSTAAGQRKIISFEYRVHGERLFQRGSIRLKNSKNLLRVELCILMVMGWLASSTAFVPI